MPVKLKPFAESRVLVQVVLRESTSISPTCRAVNRSLAVSGTNLTLFGSLKIAAASARQKSTSKPVQLPCASGKPKPARPVFEPQLRTPLAFTALSVWADAVVAAPKAKAKASRRPMRVMTQRTPEAWKVERLAQRNAGWLHPLAAYGRKAFDATRRTPIPD